MKLRSFIQAVRSSIQYMLAAPEAGMAGEPLQLPRRVIAAGCASLVLGTGALALWAAVAPLSGAVLAEGMVRDEGERKTIQHQEGGIVKEILVKDGDRVRAGQLLVTLDNVRPDAEVAALQSQLDDEEAKAARLAAERDMKSTITFPQRLISQVSDPRIAALL
ncbi:biotin/lipoyl-binding protein [Paraburkholderia ribeironis]|uniref:biotin/lipoyl-binding protein n=1 Tax=Paraburkholderia ribeironis TaxID=1247936 RepID=UPI001FE5FC5D|nr:biotin/lipoyl-binding protein [Paraburkholderia ribeironis]